MPYFWFCLEIHEANVQLRRRASVNECLETPQPARTLWHFSSTHWQPPGSFKSYVDTVWKGAKIRENRRPKKVKNGSSVKCLFKGDTSETSFRSVCKMAFLAPRTATSRATRVLLPWFLHGSIALTVLFQASLWSPENFDAKSHNMPLFNQNDPKMIAKRHQNEARVTP